MQKDLISQEKIKEIVVQILYLDDISEVSDSVPLFTELDLSSIDFIDLCFELKKETGKDVVPETLWPFNKMMTNSDCFQEGVWTKEGWAEVCQILNLDKAKQQEKIEQLYERFTVDYIQKRLEII